LGRYGQTKTQLFLFNPRNCLVFVCHPFHLVLCSLFRLPGQLIAPFAINSRCFCVAISSRFQVFQPLSVSRFRAETSFSGPYHWDWESGIPICFFKPLQWLQRSRPSVPQTYCRQRSAQPSSSPPRPSSSPQASQPSSPPSSASSPSADSSPFCPTSS